MPIDPDDFDKPGLPVTPRPIIVPPPRVIAAKPTQQSVPPRAYHSPRSVPHHQVASFLEKVIVIIFVGILVVIAIILAFAVNRRN